MKLEFKRDTQFRKQFFVPDSFAHPAKMDAQLLIWIVEKFTKPRETILDPMAGSGTTMLACTLGRDVVLVELEEKFCKMMRDNWEQVKMRPQLGCDMGDCQIIQGDARQLEGLLVDKIVTSPPYTNRMDGGAELQEGFKPYSGEPTGWFTTRPQDNIGNLRYGDVDSIITSPPYEGSLEMGSRHTQGGIPSRDKKLGQTGTYDTVDSIITSPPYEETIGKQGGQIRDDLKGFIGKSCAEARQYAHNDQNIGNLKSDNYLSAMLQVYQQCFAVLKAGGLMILVTKNFIRNKAIVRLDLDTIKLCEQAGFQFIERHYRKLPAQSFWRVIYHQKYPDVDMIDYEDILVFRK